MKNSKIILRSFIHAVGVTVYTAGVAWLIFSLQHTFKAPSQILIALFMFLLLIISATITGFLVIAKPAQIYFAGDKRDALMMLFCTIVWLAFFALIVIGFMFLL